MHRYSNRNSVTKFDEKLELLDGKGDGWLADEARAMQLTAVESRLRLHVFGSVGVCIQIKAAPVDELFRDLHRRLLNAAAKAGDAVEQGLCLSQMGAVLGIGLVVNRLSTLTELIHDAEAFRGTCRGTGQTAAT